MGKGNFISNGKKLNRIIALLLAITIFALDLSFVAVADEGQTSSPLMKFEQTGFDSSTGILTMTLRARADGLDEAIPQYVRDGSFAFSVDTSVLLPVTSPPENSVAAREVFFNTKLPYDANSFYNREYNYVASGYTYIDGNGELQEKGTVKAVKYYDNYTRENTYYPDNTGRLGQRSVWSQRNDPYAFEHVIEGNIYTDYVYYPGTDTYNGTDFDTNDDATGYFGKLRRTDNYADMFFQFKFKPTVRPGLNGVGVTLDGNGKKYVDIVKLEFLCVSGYDDDGNPIAAQSEDVLYSKAITVPKTQEEADAILEVFSYVPYEGTTNKQYLAVTAAGFRVREYKDTFSSMPSKGSYYYFDTPSFMNPGPVNESSNPESGSASYNGWYLERFKRYRYWDGTGDDPANGSGVPDELPSVSQGEGEYPELSYRNDDVDYSITRFYASTANTYYSEDPVDYDFERPEGEGRDMPRYSIPTAIQSDENDKDGNWIPESYLLSPKGSLGTRRIELKYLVGTDVSTNSITNPETEDIQAFMDGMEWEFAFNSQGVLLKDCVYTLDESVSEKTIKTASGEAKVRYAVIGEPDNPDELAAYRAKFGEEIIGKKIQVVTFADGSVKVTPIGVTLDMIDSVVYYEEYGATAEDETKTAKATAPQLNIKSAASESTSYLWAKRIGEDLGQIYIKPTYVDSGGMSYSSDDAMPVKIYREDTKASRIEIDMSSLPQKNGESVIELTKTSDIVSGSSDAVVIKSKIYDQYGNQITSGSRPVLEIAPTQKTINDMWEVTKGKESKNFWNDYKNTIMESMQVLYGDDWEAVPEYLQEAKEKFAKGMSPYKIVEDEDDITKYYIQYKSRTESAFKRAVEPNDIFPGDYTISASYTISRTEVIYSGGESDGKVFTLEKEADYLANAQISASSSTLRVTQGANRDGYDAVYDIVIPVLSGTSKTQGTVNTQIMEMPNQWRDYNNGNQSDRASQYDIYTGMRQGDGDGPINMVLAEAFDINFGDTKMEVVLGSGKGLTINDDYSLTVTSEMPTNTEVKYSLEVICEGETIEKTYLFSFTRQKSEITRIQLNDADAAAIAVPEKSSGVSFKRLVNPIPRDQYGEPMSWEQVYAGDDNAYGKFQVIFTPALGTSGTEGISYNQSTNEISVTSQARDIDLKMKIKYRLLESVEKVIQIRRNASIPTTIQSVTYSSRTLYSPHYGRSPVISSVPAVVVLDQYGDVMKAEDYKQVWAITKQTNNDGKVSINKDTGAITVGACAVDNEITLQLKINDKNGVYRTQWSSTSWSGGGTISILRDDPVVSVISIVESEINYGEAVNKFSLTGLSQYNEEIAVSTAVWELTEVKLESGTVLTAPVESGTGIRYNSGSSFYEAVVNGTVVFNFKNTSEVAFVNNLTDINLAPVSIKIKAATGGVNTEKTIDINREASKISSIYVGDTLLTDITVPSVPGASIERELIPTARDQYGFNISANITWVLKELETGNNRDKIEFSQVDGSGYAKNGRIKVENGASPAVLTVTATAENRANPLDGYSKDFAINIVREGTSIPSRVAITQVPDNGEMELPGIGKTNKYTIKARVYDNYGDVMPSEQISWHSDSSYVTLSSTNDSEITVAYNAAARDLLFQGTAVEVIITAKRKNDDTIPSVGETISIVLENRVPTAAVPELSNVTLPASDPNKVLTPTKGEENVATITGTVSDQYGKEMPGEEAKIELTTVADGILARGASANSELDIVVQSYTTATYFNVKAYPAGKPGVTGAAGIKGIDLERGPTYLAEVIKGTILGGDASPEEWEVPAWTTDVQANIPSTGKTHTSFSLEATMLTQFGGKFTGSAKLEWTFVDKDGNQTEANYGIKFIGAGASTDGKTYTGDVAEVQIQNDAIDPATGELDKDIYIKVKPNSAYDASEKASYEKVFKVNVNRAEQVPTYLYVKGVDANGEDTINRPYKAAGKETKIIEPLVLDQYGFECIDEVGVDLAFDPSDLEDLGYIIERVYEDGVPEEGEEPKLLKYIIYDDDVPEGSEDDKGTLLAEYIIESRSLTIYSACTIEEFPFVMTSQSPLLNIPKPVTIKLKTDDQSLPREILFAGDKNHQFIINNISEANQTEAVASTMYNQYGDIIAPANYSIKWELMMKSEDSSGNIVYVPYTETDEDGNEKLPGQRLVVLLAAKGRSTGLRIQPEQYQADTKIYLVCTVLDTNGSTPYTYTDNTVDPPVQKGVSFTAEISVTRRRTPPKPPTGGGAPSYYLVTYKVEENGELDGTEVETVLEGEKPVSIPSVKTEKGYAFRGWMLEAGTMVDVKETPITDNITYIAKVENLNGWGFIGGYEDGTVQPQRGVTRGEFTKMLALALGDYDENVDYKSLFTDVPNNKWYENYISYAYENGIVEGYDNGTFRPEKIITRAEAAKMTADALKIEAKETGPIFSDVVSGRWYTPYVETLYEMKIVSGYEDGTYKPGKTIKRSEAAKMIVMITDYYLTDMEIENIKNSSENPFRDLKRQNWEYAYIIRAAGVA